MHATIKAWSHLACIGLFGAGLVGCAPVAVPESVARLEPLGTPGRDIAERRLATADLAAARMDAAAALRAAGAVADPAAARFGLVRGRTGLSVFEPFARPVEPFVLRFDSYGCRATASTEQQKQWCSARAFAVQLENERRQQWYQLRMADYCASFERRERHAAFLVACDAACEAGRGAVVRTSEHETSETCRARSATSSARPDALYQAWPTTGSALRAFDGGAPPPIASPRPPLGTGTGSWTTRD